MNNLFQLLKLRFYGQWAMGDSMYSTLFIYSVPSPHNLPAFVVEGLELVCGPGLVATEWLAATGYYPEQNRRPDAEAMVETAVVAETAALAETAGVEETATVTAAVV
jgi:hypothetical protein